MSIVITALILFAAYLLGLVVTRDGLSTLIRNPIGARVLPLTLAVIAVYFFLIPLNAGSPLFWLSIAVSFIFGARIQLIENSNPDFMDLLPVMSGCAFVVAITIASTPIVAIFNAEPFKNAITVEQTENFDAKSILLDGVQARFVDRQLAGKGVKELTGEQFAMGSRFEFTTPTIQLNDSRLVWVAPLTHKSFIKWWNNKNAPGYAYISANNYDDRQLVTGPEHEINYGDTGFFGFSNVSRHVYLNGYSDEIISDSPRFELDEQRRGHWVFTTYKKAYLFAIDNPTGVLVVDAQTGEINKFDLDQVPSWIDTVFVDGVTEKLISYAFSYVKGAFNAWFVGEDVLEASPGTFMVYTKNGEAKWYTGVQSSGAQEGTMGFLLSDTRTGKTTLYRRAGITEQAAANVAEGLVQDLGYRSSDPLPYNVNGENTFISILKDDSGNRQGIALVRYSNRNIAGWGKTLQEAERKYMTSMAQQNDGSTDVRGGNTLQTVNAKVSRITHLDDTTYLTLTTYFTLDDNALDGRIFSVAHAKSEQVIVTRPGDDVSVDVVNLDNNLVPVVNFSNKTLFRPQTNPVAQQQE
jgi:hypothetical protein